MASEDITFCANDKCEVMECVRNPKHIKQHWREHSFAFLEGTEDCLKKEKKKEKVVQHG